MAANRYDAAPGQRRCGRPALRSGRASATAIITRKNTQKFPNVLAS